MSDPTQPEPLPEPALEHRLAAAAIGDLTPEEAAALPADPFTGRITAIVSALSASRNEPLPANWAMRRAQVRRNVIAAVSTGGGAATLRYLAAAAAVLLMVTIGVLQTGGPGALSAWLTVAESAGAQPAGATAVAAGTEVRTGGAGFVSGDLAGGWRIQAGPTTQLTGTHTDGVLRIVLTRGDLIVARASSGEPMEIAMPSGWRIEFAADAQGTAAVRHIGAPYTGEPFVRDDAAQTVSGTYADVPVSTVAADLRQVLSRSLHFAPESQAGRAIVSIRLDRVPAAEAFDVARRCFAAFHLDVRDDGLIEADAASPAIGRAPQFGESPAFVQVWDARGIRVCHGAGSAVPLTGSHSVLLMKERASGPAQGYGAPIAGLEWRLAASNPIPVGAAGTQKPDVRVYPGASAVMRLGDELVLAVRDRVNSRDTALRYLRTGDPFRDADGSFDGRIDRIVPSGFWVASSGASRFYALSETATR